MVAIPILLLVAVVALFDLAALGWGVDSSDAASDPRERARPSI
jgi:hypothetical protein